MRVLVIGGGGLVGGLILPKLTEKHVVTVFDLRPPELEVPYQQGDVTDYRAVRKAMRDQQAVVFLAMGPKDFPDRPESAIAQFDVAVTGLYTVLRAAGDENVRHAVYASSMSVYATDVKNRERFPDESVPADAVDSYGLAKRLGEDVCRAACANGMSVISLRLCFPTPPEDWDQPGDDPSSVIATSAADTARAFLLALERQGHGYEAFAISGDNQGRLVNIERARTVLGWQPFDPTG